jgi:hypothetical protein
MSEYPPFSKKEFERLVIGWPVYKEAINRYIPIPESHWKLFAQLIATVEQGFRNESTDAAVPPVHRPA